MARRTKQQDNKGGKIAMNQTQLINKFKDGGTRGKASNMLINGNTLFSYGRHFPLLIRRDFGFLLNGDRYSVTTSQHQSSCRRIATIIIPFSALRAAQINPCEFKLIDKTEARIDTRKYKDKEGNLKTIEERRPESCVIAQEDRYFLSSMDNNSYFVSELPGSCNTVQQAFDILKPPEIKDKDYQRQGEWFIIEATDLPIAIYKDGKPIEGSKMQKLLYKGLYQNYILPHKPHGNPHIATRGGCINGKHYISGQLRHPEHRMLRLSKAGNPIIFQAWENRAINSWSALGNVD